ncbi:DUF4192 family protein [Nocardia sp. NPDC056100]|uniref:DUF4192 family protein n=1 Tax=Nocardia sp. NPDC056100 TaxID=3345712 RepID=UPI0035D6D067
MIPTDVPREGKPSNREIAQRIVETASRTEIVAVLAIVVDERLAGSARILDAKEGHRGLLATLELSLHQVRTTPARGWAVPLIQAGSPWWSLLESTQLGAQSDPAASVLATGRILARKAPYRSRIELVGGRRGRRYAAQTSRR